MQVVFETHSTTLDNEGGIATGWLPGELSAAGRQQAADLGRRRAADCIAAVFCSDLARAAQTAAIAFDGTGLPVLLDWRLRWSGRRVLVIGHVATRWGLEIALLGTPLEDLVNRPFDWQPGWEFLAG